MALSKTMRNARDVLTKEELALALALAHGPSPIGAGDRTPGDRPSIGIGMSMDMLVLMQLAAEELLRKLEPCTRGFPDAVFEERREEIRRELVEQGRIGPT